MAISHKKNSPGCLCCLPPCIITMTVMDMCGKPLPGVSITITGAGSFSGTTDAFGAFTFGPAAVGTYSCTITKTGYISQTYTAVVDSHCGNNFSKLMSRVGVTAGICCHDCDDIIGSPLYLTDSNVTLMPSTIRLGTWTWYYTVPATIYSANPFGRCGYQCPATTTGDTQVYVRMTCPQKDAYGILQPAQFLYSAFAGWCCVSGPCTWNTDFTGGICNPLNLTSSPVPQWLDANWYNCCSSFFCDECSFVSMSPPTTLTSGGTCSLPFTGTWSLGSTWAGTLEPTLGFGVIGGCYPGTTCLPRSISLPGLATGTATVSE